MDSNTCSNLLSVSERSSRKRECTEVDEVVPALQRFVRDPWFTHSGDKTLLAKGTGLSQMLDLGKQNGQQFLPSTGGFWPSLRKPFCRTEGSSATKMDEKEK